MAARFFIDYCEGESAMKILVIKRKSLIIFGILVCLVIAIIVSAFSFVPAAVSAMAQKRLIPIYGVDRNDKEVSLTFDAAWGNAILGNE